MTKSQAVCWCRYFQCIHISTHWKHSIWFQICVVNCIPFSFNFSYGSGIWFSSTYTHKIFCSLRLTDKNRNSKPTTHIQFLCQQPLTSLHLRTTASGSTSCNQLHGIYSGIMCEALLLLNHYLSASVFIVFPKKFHQISCTASTIHIFQIPSASYWTLLTPIVCGFLHSVLISVTVDGWYDSFPYMPCKTFPKSQFVQTYTYIPIGLFLQFFLVYQKVTEKKCFWSNKKR